MKRLDEHLHRVSVFRISATAPRHTGRPYRISRELCDYSGRKFIFISLWQLVATARGAGVAGLEVFRVNICKYGLPHSHRPWKISRSIDQYVCHDKYRPRKENCRLYIITVISIIFFRLQCHRLSFNCH